VERRPAAVAAARPALVAVRRASRPRQTLTRGGMEHACVWLE
jgi:hypothetical protein